MSSLRMAAISSAVARGTLKEVIHANRMLPSNNSGGEPSVAALHRERPVVIDSLRWKHAFDVTMWSTAL